jgi:hypothetical protein
VNREKFFKRNGAFFPRDVLALDDEYQIALDIYKFFDELLASLSEEDDFRHLSIEFCVVNNYSFNAHAAKIAKNEYLIAFRSGLLPRSIQLIGEQIDFLQKRITIFNEKEEVLGIGLFFALSALFGHELGHILRGHIGASNQRNMADQKHELDDLVGSSMYPEFIEDADEFQRLVELDADTFSASIISIAIIRVNSKLESNGKVTWKEVIELAYYSVFLLHNELNHLTNSGRRYPPPILRTEVVFENVVSSLASVWTIPTNELKSAVFEAQFQIFSHLKDVGMFEQDTSHAGLSKLDGIVADLAAKYPRFSQFVANTLVQNL